MLTDILEPINEEKVTLLLIIDDAVKEDSCTVLAIIVLVAILDPLKDEINPSFEINVEPTREDNRMELTIMVDPVSVDIPMSFITNEEATNVDNCTLLARIVLAVSDDVLSDNMVPLLIAIVDAVIVDPLREPTCNVEARNDDRPVLLDEIVETTNVEIFILAPVVVETVKLDRLVVLANRVDVFTLDVSKVLTRKEEAPQLDVRRLSVRSDDAIMEDALIVDPTRLEVIIVEERMMFEKMVDATKEDI